MKLFLDTEFTGLHQNTTLISIALIAETGEKFYAELADYDESQVDDWLKENVISQLFYNDYTWIDGIKEKENYRIKTSHSDLRDNICDWLILLGAEKFEIWSDCLAYDWVLFCEIFGGAMNLPESIYYIPFDICTLFKMKGINPDISRKDYSRFDGDSHNALSDAMMIKACYENLTKRNIIEDIINGNVDKKPEKPKEFKSGSTIAKEHYDKMSKIKYQTPSETYKKVKESIANRPEWQRKTISSD